MCVVLIGHFHRCPASSTFTLSQTHVRPFSFWAHGSTSWAYFCVWQYQSALAILTGNHMCDEHSGAYSLVIIGRPAREMDLLVVHSLHYYRYSTMRSPYWDTYKHVVLGMYKPVFSSGTCGSMDWHDFCYLSMGALAGTPIDDVFIHDSWQPQTSYFIQSYQVMDLMLLFLSHHRALWGPVGSAFLIVARFKCESRLRAIVLV